MKSLVSDFKLKLPVFYETQEITPTLRQDYSYEFLSGKESDESKAARYLKFVKKSTRAGYKIISNFNEGVTHLIAGTNQNAFNAVE